MATTPNSYSLNLKGSILMKSLMTSITLLAAIFIGSISYAESKTTIATNQTVMDKEVKAVPIPVSVPRISEDVFSFDPDDC